MSVLVSDVLALDLLKDAQLAAGEAGLQREVSRVNFTDSPLDEKDPGDTLVQKGDLYILSFYSQSDNENDIYNLINFYIRTGSSCCIAINSYMKEFPLRVRQLANKNDYPLILISDRIPYASLIQKITTLIMTEQLDMYAEVKLHSLLHEKLTPQEQVDTLGYLIPVYPRCFTCLYLHFPSVSRSTFRRLKNQIAAETNLPFLTYRNGGFLIVDLDVYKKMELALQRIQKVCTSYKTPFFIGISSPTKGVSQFPSAFQESLDASLVGEVTETSITFYEKIPLYHLLLQLKSRQALEEFCNRILGPLQEYEERHNVELIQTVALYLKQNGNMAETAEQLNTHINTIRFRIHKAKSLLGLEKEPFSFIEQMSMALKGKLLLSKMPPS